VTMLKIRALQVMKALMEVEGVRAYFVGGCVRDRVMRRLPHDIDVEVFGVSYGDLIRMLEAQSRHCYRDVQAVGKDFGVVKFTTDAGVIDFAIPRREYRVGVGHTAFECEFDPSISEKDALSRRDFTMNAMYEDVEGRIIDPFDGQRDIKDRVLRATTMAYMEDPLRVLRGMQFAARFGMAMDERTKMYSTAMLDEFNAISVERIWMEWKKWALAYSPGSWGLGCLEESQWLLRFPELAKLVDLPQDPDWHPEGDAWRHTRLVVDRAAQVARMEELDENDTLTLVFAALLHDVGKPSTTTKINGRWRSPGHASIGAPIAEDFLSSIGAPRWLIDRVVPLVREHMVHIGSAPTKRVVQRLARRLEPASIVMLRHLVWCDYAGRPPALPQDPLKLWVERAEEWAVSEKKPDRILMGRHLLAAGLEPGTHIGEILNAAYEAQLDGEISNVEDALAWAKVRMGEFI